jgi:hypothetical protein
MGQWYRGHWTLYIRLLICVGVSPTQDFPVALREIPYPWLGFAPGTQQT